MIYLFIIILTLVGYLRFDLSTTKGWEKNFYFFFEFVVLVSVVALRYRVGSDSLSYEDSYDSINGLEELRNYSFSTSNHGFLWYAFVAFCQNISKEWVVLQVVHSLIINVAVFRFAKKYCTMPFLAIFLYSIFFYLYFNTEILRASLGVAVFLLWGYEALLNKNWIRYFILAFISSNFHIECVALFFFPLAFFIGKTKINEVKLIVILIGAIILLNVFKLDSFLFSFAQFSDALEYRAGHYSVAIQQNTNSIVARIIMLLPIFFCLWGTKFLDMDSNTARLIRGLMIVYMIFSVFSIYHPAFFSRLIDAVRVIYIVTLADILGSLKKRRSSVLYTALFVIVLFCGGFMQYREPLINIKYYPYHSIINPEREPQRELLFGE